MNKLQKLILYTACATIPTISLAQEAQQDTTEINKDLFKYETELEQHPLMAKFFDSYLQYDALDFNNNNYDRDPVTKLNRLEKHLEDNLDFFIEIENNSVRAGFKFYFGKN